MPLTLNYSYSSNSIISVSIMAILYTLSRPQFFVQAFTRTSVALVGSSRGVGSNVNSGVFEKSFRGIATDIGYSSKEFELYPPAEHLRGDIVVPQKGQRIVSFGDVHGDLAALANFLKTAKVLDDTFNWCGGDTLLVQVGDVLDRGDHELACFYLLCRLSKQAQEAGGGVLLLHGNHEALNAVGLFNYALPEGNVEFEEIIGKGVDKYFQNQRWRIQFAGNQPSRWAACEPGGLLSEPLLSKMKVSVVVGHTVFVHAGLTKKHIDDFGGISGMNDSASRWFLNVQHGVNRNEGDFSSIEEIIDYANNRAQLASNSLPPCLGGGIGSPSPVWMRDYSQPSDGQPKNPSAQQMIDTALEALGEDVQRMVMGHTPQTQINAALKGKAWRVDVGASKGVASGKPEVLEIIHEGGENGEDIVNILTLSGATIPSKDRQVVDIEQLI